MLIAYYQVLIQKKRKKTLEIRMTDSSMNFGPAWIRNLRSEGTTGGGTNTTGTRYQLAEHRYGREEMLAIFDKSLKAPPTLAAFKALYSEQSLIPLALLPTTEEERAWQSRPTSVGGPNRGRGVSLERGGGSGGGRPTRGRGNYPSYGRTTSAYDSGWGNGEQPDWSPRKDYNVRGSTTDNWRRVRSNNEDDDGWRNMNSGRPLHEKWGRSTSWRGEGDTDERNGPPERGGRQHWHENNRGGITRRSWENEDHLPEWINENPTEGGGTFDERGAFHGSDDEQLNDNKINRRELQKSASQQQITSNNNNNNSNKHKPPSLTTSKSAISLSKTEDNDKQLNERDKQSGKTKENTAADLDLEKPSSITDKHNKLGEKNKSDKKEEKLRPTISTKPNDNNSNSSSSSNNNNNTSSNNTGPPLDSSSTNMDKVEEEFARMQEDLVLKLVVDEETPKPTIQNSSSSSAASSSSSSSSTTIATTSTNFDIITTTATVQQPPPNLIQPPPPPPPLQLPSTQSQPSLHEKWYYQDPQGTRQGPFLNVEMAEWYKAGYFSNQLHVMRECDERYFLLGELINICGGDNPFLSNIRFPILKNDTQVKLNDDLLSYQLLSQLAFKQQISMRNLAEPWSALTLQQQELAAQRLLLQQQQQQQQQQQLPHDLPYMQQNPPTNPLMFMINQMQQSNKLPGSVLVDKPPNNSNNSVPNQLDPLLVQQMGGGSIHSLQNRIPTPNLHNHLPGGLTSLPSDGLTSGLPGLPTPGLTALPNLHGGLPTGLNINRPPSHSPIDQLPPPPPPQQQQQHQQQTNQDNDPITNFLKQFHQQKQRTQMPLDGGSLWHKPVNPFNIPQSTTTPPTTTTTPQWTQQPDVPLSMWDLQPSTLPTPLTSDNHQSVAIDKTTDTQQNHEIEKDQQHQQQQQQKSKEENSQKELKKKKEFEEKQAKKEAEEKRKQEQRKQEVEKRVAEEKKKKDEERIRKELEKAKKEAEEKRMRELEEKRRLKEQRKAEEEAKKKSDELRKQEEEKSKREAKEREERSKHTETRLAQNQVIKAAKTAPWSQSNSTQGMSLTDIQKAEKERRAQEAALLLKQQQLQEQQQQQQQQQQQIEKSGGLQLNWAKKPVEPRSVKSFAEIQAEEQEKLAKMTAEARLAAQQREKEAPTTSNTNSIWNGQSLTWANAATSATQWNSNNAGGGFWDDVLVKSSTKPSTVPKSSSTSAMTSVVVKQPPQKQIKQTKPKKEEPPKSVNSNNNNNNSNNSANDEFTNWCYKTLSTISTNVDIPTFVSFLRDIESAYDVRDYCKEYLGDGPATQQFATNFLEKRRSFKPKTNAHKDDMCSPAPAITPSTTTQHSAEFQEVKGKNKKNKKSKMLKVDSRILGFQVTSAPDRINVGDRDYGDNS